MFLVDNLANVSIFLYPLSILDTTVVVLQVQNNLNAGPKDKRYHNNIEYRYDISFAVFVLSDCYHDRLPRILLIIGNIDERKRVYSTSFQIRPTQNVKRQVGH